MPLFYGAVARFPRRARTTRVPAARSASDRRDPPAVGQPAVTSSGVTTEGMKVVALHRARHQASRAGGRPPAATSTRSPASRLPGPPATARWSGRGRRRRWPPWSTPPCGTTRPSRPTPRCWRPWPAAPGAPTGLGQADDAEHDGHAVDDGGQRPPGDGRHGGGGHGRRPGPRGARRGHGPPRRGVAPGPRAGRWWCSHGGAFRAGRAATPSCGRRRLRRAPAEQPLQQPVEAGPTAGPPAVRLGEQRPPSAAASSSSGRRGPRWGRTAAPAGRRPPPAAPPRWGWHPGSGSGGSGRPTLCSFHTSCGSARLSTMATRSGGKWPPALTGSPMMSSHSTLLDGPPRWGRAPPAAPTSPQHEVVEQLVAHGLGHRRVHDDVVVGPAQRGHDPAPQGRGQRAARRCCSRSGVEQDVEVARLGDRGEGLGQQRLVDVGADQVEDLPAPVAGGSSPPTTGPCWRRPAPPRLPPGRTARASVDAASRAVVVLWTTMSLATKQWVPSTVRSHTCRMPAGVTATTSSQWMSPPSSRGFGSVAAAPGARPGPHSGTLSAKAAQRLRREPPGAALGGQGVWTLTSKVRQRDAHGGAVGHLQVGVPSRPTVPSAAQQQRKRASWSGDRR